MRERDEQAWAEAAVLAVIGLTGWVLALLGGYVIGCVRRHPDSASLKGAMAAWGAVIAAALVVGLSGGLGIALALAAVATILMLVASAAIDASLRLPHQREHDGAERETLSDLLGRWD